MKIEKHQYRPKKNLSVELHILNLILHKSWFTVFCKWHGHPQGSKREFPPLEIGTKNQTFLVNLKLVA